MTEKNPSSIIHHPSSGFRMPAEWEKHEATWLGWPHHRGDAGDWPGKYEAVLLVLSEIIRVLAEGERVCLIVKDAKEEERARAMLKDAGVNLAQVTMHFAATNRTWMRDSGPTFLTRENPQGGRSRLLLDWKFNAWAKYPNHALDDKVPQKIAEVLGLPCIQPVFHKDGKARRVVLEGGAIDVNGKGTLLATEECLLSDVQARNPGFTHEDYEQVFAEYLGAGHVVWLGKGIAGDDTHGHVDDIARFVREDTVVAVTTSDRADPDYTPLQQNLRTLRTARDQSGRQLTVVALPMPRAVRHRGERLPASYANFLIANKTVLVPTFNDPNDRIALNILAALFPGREVVGIHAVDLVWGLGTIHCLSQQQPE